MIFRNLKTISPHYIPDYETCLSPKERSNTYVIYNIFQSRQLCVFVVCVCGCVCAGVDGCTCEHVYVISQEFNKLPVCQKSLRVERLNKKCQGPPVSDSPNGVQVHATMPDTWLFRIVPRLLCNIASILTSGPSFQVTV